MANPVVQTKCGSVRGVREACEGRGFDVFRGIPFAAPPVGELRFWPPRAAAPWSGELDASSFGPAPPQRVDEMLDRLGLLSADTACDEDCLTLNVFTPAADGARRPVMVWIHGGAFAKGTGGRAIYDGKRLASRDVVVVTLNYRVGMLGFMHLDAAAGDGSAVDARSQQVERGQGQRGNWGLLDQLAALRWVRDEIAAFGGDSGCVTVFGESAGAGSIISLLAMPEAKGLFERAIVQSASPTGMIPPGDAVKRAEHWMAELGVDDRAQLRELPWQRLVDAQEASSNARAWSTGMYCVPVIDGDVLPEAPMQAIARGAGAEVDLLIGTTEQEMRLYTWDMDMAALSEELLERQLALELPGAETESVIAGYRKLLGSRGAGTTPTDLYLAIVTDVRLRLHATQVADAHARAGGARTYMYAFTPRSPMKDGLLGSCHALDLPFTFGTLDTPGMAAFAGEGPEVRRASERMMDAWSSFARSGVPADEDVARWPAYTPESRLTVSIAAKGEVLEDPLARERALLSAVDFRPNGFGPGGSQ